MDMSVVTEVLIEKGYLTILSSCIIFLILLLILRKVIPRTQGVKALYEVKVKKVFLEEEFEVKITLTAGRKVMIEELAFFVECFILGPGAGSQGISCFFHKEVAAKDMPLYPRCTLDETRKIMVPLRGVTKFQEESSRKQETCLPGTFSSLNGHYAIQWKTGYRIKLRESYEPIEGTEAIVVYPVAAGW
jgi:hypothetical protein